MTKSLQDQLLNAGLIDNKKAKKISKESRKAKKVQHRSKGETISDAQAAAISAQQSKRERDNALNQQRNLDAEKKSIAAQIAQLVKHYRLERQQGDTEYNFSDKGTIKKIRVTSPMSEEIIRGRLCVARQGDNYEVIPKPIADKIRERDEGVIVVYNKKEADSAATGHSDAAATVDSDAAADSDDAYYAQFEIPDDLVW